MFYKKEEFLDRVRFAIKENYAITLVVGAPISFDRENKSGVADVAGIIESIKFSFQNDSDGLDRLNKAISRSDGNSYQNAFSHVLGVRGARYANKIIRESVLKAYGKDGIESVDDYMDDALWCLPPAVNAIGKLIASRPASFGHKVITTNFDPLLEVAIRRHGGSAFSSFYHRDGTPATSNAEGVNVIHLHGFWKGSDTLHTPTQLKQVRPQLKSYLSGLLSKTLVVVIAYGGWDDVLGAAMESLVLDDAAEPEILWAFRNSDISHLELSEPALLDRLRPGIDRGRVQLYGGVDCHEILPMLAEELGSLSETSGKSNNQRFDVIVRALTPSEQLMVSPIRAETERFVDARPRVDGFIGRQGELLALGNADASVVCISGFGGQGKSILAAKFLLDLGVDVIKDWRDCREEGNTAYTALSLFCEKIAGKPVIFDNSSSSAQKDLVDTILSHINGKKVALVLDNIDTYIDLESQRPIGIIGAFCDRLLEVDASIQLILTCRPQIQIPHSRFFGLPLMGLDESSSRTLFSSKSGGYDLDDSECAALMKLTDGHPLYLSMLAAQRLSTGKSLSIILNEVEESRSDVPAMILRSTYKLLNADQMDVIRTLAELEHPAHEVELESVTGYRFNKLSKHLKRLKDLSLTLERRNYQDKTLIDLHPLVRQFLRKEYPKSDRRSFIDKIIIYFDSRLALVAKQINKEGIPTHVLEVWLHKIEVLCNLADWNLAIYELCRVHMQVESSGFGGDYVRLGVKVLAGVDWLTAIDESKDFRRFLNIICREMSYLGQHDEVAKLMEHYEVSVGARGADRLNSLEIRAHDAWLRAEYLDAIEHAREALSLSKIVDVGSIFSPEHTLALVLRDSGDIEGAMTILLEGLTLDEAANFDSEKKPSYFGNIGRCMFLVGEYDRAMLFYKICAKKFQVGIYPNHNGGWLRMWVGENLCAMGRVSEGYSFICAAKHVWSKSSAVLERSADKIIKKLHAENVNLDMALVPEWQAEKIFNTWANQPL